jgi:DNA-directed RNA polymerase specialized sigma subunit
VTGLAEKLSQMPQREKDAAYSYYILSESVMEHSSKAGISYLSARRSLDKARERIRKSLLAQTREPDWQG